MDSTVLIPLLYPMDEKFADLRDGSRIRVVRPDGEHVGVLHVTRQVDAQRFGVIVQFGPTNATGNSATPASSDHGFVATGHSGLPMHRLTLDELHQIQRTGDPEIPFVLTAAQP